MLFSFCPCVARSDELSVLQIASHDWVFTVQTAKAFPLNSLALGKLLCNGLQRLLLNNILVSMEYIYYIQLLHNIIPYAAI